MNLLSGLEKFGLKADDTANIFEDEKKTAAAAKSAVAAAPKQETVVKEEDFLLKKEVRCPVCDKTFKTKMVKNGRVKSLEPDLDLRPRFANIDPNKYKITSCPFCGYTAMNQFFDHISMAQIKLIKEEVGSKFTPSDTPEPETFTYDEAIDRYKLALFNAMAKKGKTSEKAYICLYIAWVYRGKAETLDPNDAKQAAELKDCKEQEDVFYGQAYEGFTKAISSENFPICGLSETAMDCILAVMSYHFKKYDMASKCISNVLKSSSASQRTKDNMLELKEKIVADLKTGK